MAAPSANSVIIAHVAAQTKHDPGRVRRRHAYNYAPLAIAERFGTHEAMYPGRIDLGFGRAPGGDQQARHALRRGRSTADNYPRDVAELRAT